MDVLLASVGLNPQKQWRACSKLSYCTTKLTQIHDGELQLWPLKPVCLWKLDFQTELLKKKKYYYTLFCVGSIYTLYQCKYL